MNVIFDTSVWIEFFKGKDDYFNICQQIIEKREVKTIEIIFAELLQGALNKREIDLIRNYYELIPSIEIDQLFMEAAEYARKEKHTSKGIGLIDSAIITAALYSNSKIWTLDKKINALLDKKYLYEP